MMQTVWLLHISNKTSRSRFHVCMAQVLAPLNPVGLVMMELPVSATKILVSYVDDYTGHVATIQMMNV